MIDLTNVELDSPTAYERMTPEERVTALRAFRNFGSVEHPIFSFDFKHREDYIAANEQYSREHPDKASFAPQGSAYAAVLEARKRNPTIRVEAAETKRAELPAFVEVRSKDINPKLKPDT